MWHDSVIYVRMTLWTSGTWYLLDNLLLCNMPHHHHIFIKYDESCHDLYLCVITQSYMCWCLFGPQVCKVNLLDTTHSCVTCRIHIRDMIHSSVTWSSYILCWWLSGPQICHLHMKPSYVTCRIHVRDVTWLIFKCRNTCTWLQYTFLKGQVTYIKSTLWRHFHISRAHTDDTFIYQEHTLTTLSYIKSTHWRHFHISRAHTDDAFIYQEHTLTTLSLWKGFWHINHGVATISRLLKKYGLFCKRAL